MNSVAIAYIASTISAWLTIVGRKLLLPFRGWGSNQGQRAQRGGLDRWEALSHPVPGHSTIDGLPVAVVAVRRQRGSGELEVIRGHHPSPEWPGAAVPAKAQRHRVPAASFNPFPLRELRIADERFRYNTVAGSVCCKSCGTSSMGFGFVSDDTSLASDERSATGHRTLCEPCAEKQAHAPAL